jgi:hypothetical protein
VVIGSLASVALILAHPSLGRSLAPAAVLAALLAGPVAGGLSTMAHRPSWQSVAALVDRRCCLLDRTSAALEFSANPSPSDFERLQILDAVRHLNTIHPATIVPLRPPREWPVAGGLLAVLVGLLAWPMVSAPARAVPPIPFEPALAEACELEAAARRVEAMAQELQSADLQAMADRMRQTISELKQPGLDMRETMAKLSALQALIAELRKDFDPGPAERELQALGEVMDEARPLQPAARALQEVQLEKAARALEQAQSASFDPREVRDVPPRLKQSADAMKKKGLDRLGRATARLAQGVGGDAESLKQGTKDLAQEIREQERRKRINELMAQEQRRLTDCKNRCEARNLLGSRRQEAQPKGGGPAEASPPRSPAAPERTAGTRHEDRPPDDVPNDSPMAKNRQEITGRAGDGPSETEEIGHSSEGVRSRDRRPSRTVHQKYQREAEAVLDREPIPLGHRESIRRYFELIRPPAGDNEPSSASRGGAGQP